MCLPSSEIFGPIWPWTHPMPMQTTRAGTGKGRNAQDPHSGQAPETLSIPSLWPALGPDSCCLHPLLTLLASYCCGNKLPHTKGLKTIHMYSLRVLEVRSPKCVLLSVLSGQGVVKAELPLKALGENLFPYLFQLLEAICLSWRMASTSIFTGSNTASSNPSLQELLFCTLDLLYLLYFLRLSQV